MVDIAPGIHSISAEQYHAASGVSNSMLSWIRLPKTPLHFKAKYIDKAIAPEETPALRIGTITHRSILEPDTMDGAFYIRPENLSFATKDGKAWRDEHNDRPLISAEDAEAIRGMRDAVWAHPTASRILKTSDFERSAFAEEKGMLLKARFDALPTAGNVIADPKTCERADLESVEKAMFQYSYFIQSAYYLKVANLLGLNRALFVFIFVEKQKPHAVACYSPIDTVLDAGRMMIERDLHVLRQCYESNEWPGYSSRVEPCGLPAYAMKQIEALA